jgi:rhodanese-related sulfurtransferase
MLRILIVFSIVFGLAESNEVCNIGIEPFIVAQKPDTSYQDITVHRALHLIKRNRYNPDFVVLDVRRGDEYAEGHLPNAININYKDSGFEQQLDSLDRNKTYLVYCVAGYRSKKTQRFMQSMGFTSVINMKGGIMKWKRKKYPIETM